MYKVVSTKNGIYESTNRDFDDENPWIVEYVLGEITESFDSALFCFDKIEPAMNFTTLLYGPHAILECEVTNPRKADFICSSIKPEQIDKFWYIHNMPDKKKRGRLIREIGIECPRGTILCDTIKPTKLIYKEGNVRVRHRLLLGRREISEDY